MILGAKRFMKIHPPIEKLSTLRQVWSDTFAKGKISIRWSQTRGGIATFVSGRMEGELHDSVEDAEKWLEEIGLSKKRIYER